MIHKVWVDYKSRHAPGRLIAVCAPDGYMIYDCENKQKKTPAAREHGRGNRGKTKCTRSS